MIDREFDARLRAWYREAAIADVPANLRDRVAAIPTVMDEDGRWYRRARPRLALAWAVLALVLVATLTIGLAVGVGLLRQLFTPPTLLPDAACSPTMNDPFLADGVVLKVVAEDESIILFDDGLFLAAPNDKRSAGFRGADRGATSRRMAPSGVARIRDLVERSGLTMAGCHIDLAWSDDREFEVRYRDGRTAATHLLLSYRSMPVPSEAFLDTAARLQAQLRAPEEVLGAADWINPESSAFDGGSWLIRVGEYTSEYVRGYPRASEGEGMPRADAFRFPDGRGLWEFGDESPTQDHPRGRCAIVDQAEAARVVDALNAAADARSLTYYQDDQWWFFDEETKGQLGVSVWSVLPGEFGSCQ